MRSRRVKNQRDESRGREEREKRRETGGGPRVRESTDRLTFSLNSERRREARLGAGRTVYSSCSVRRRYAILSGAGDGA